MFTISKFFSLVVFIALMVVFFIWITGNVSDLGLFFGFRGSHTVANDIASVITSLGAVPGAASTTYEIRPNPGSQNKFIYIVDIRDKIVCVSSYINNKAGATTDCASHPYDLNEEDETPLGSFSEAEGKPEWCFTFNKKVDKDSGISTLSFTEGCS